MSAFNSTGRLAARVRYDRWLLLVVGATSLAAALRLARLTETPLWGDDYSSIYEAHHLGASLISLPYDLALRFFLSFATPIELARLPGIIFGIAAVPVLYALSTVLIGRLPALVASLLLAASPYAVGYSQEVRFYSLFLLTGLLALYALARFLRDGPSPSTLAFLLIADALCIASDALGILLVIAQLVSILVCRLSWRKLMIALPAGLGGLLVVFLVGSWEPTRRWILDFYGQYVNGFVPYGPAKGLGLFNFLKLPWTFFVFSFGERVYPLWLALTLPGILLILILTGLGLWSLRTNRLALSVLLPCLIVCPLLLYFVLDPLSPSHGYGSSPRYLIPLTGPLFVLIAAGVTSLRRWWLCAVALALALIINAAALFAYWENVWDYNGYSPDWNRVSRLISREAVPGTLILLDGRSMSASNFYWRSLESKRHLRQTAIGSESGTALRSATRVITIVDTDSLVPRREINSALDRIQRRFHVAHGFVRYPLFVYVFDRGQLGSRGHHWAALPVPLNLFDISQQDLSLPIHLRLPRQGSLKTFGCFSLGSDSAKRKLTIRVPTRVKLTSLVLATSLQSDHLSPGSIVEFLQLSNSRGTQTIALRKGTEVDDWDTVGANGGGSKRKYALGYRWEKLLAIVGNQRYPQAYQQFEAGIAVVRFHLRRSFARLTIRFVPPNGQLRIWAAAVQ